MAKSNILQELKSNITDEKFIGKILIFTGAYFGVVRPVLQRLNIVDTKAERQEKKKQAIAEKVVVSGVEDNPYNYASFFANAAKKGVQPLIITNATATRYAEVIRDWFHIYKVTDMYDERAAFGVLDACKTQSVFAWVCKKFFEMYSVSMYSWLKQGFTDKEFSEFNAKLITKPLYKV